MASSKEYLQFILEQLSGLEEKETSVYKRPVYNSKIDDFKNRSSNGDANRFF